MLNIEIQLTPQEYQNLVAAWDAWMQLSRRTRSKRVHAIYDKTVYGPLTSHEMNAVSYKLMRGIHKDGE